MVWTVIPAVILVFIAIPTIQTIFKTAEVPTDNPLVIEVIGHQWWWEFRYPEYNLVTAGDMHVPTGRTVDLRMTTADVVHSFWTPQLAGKRDVFPKRDNRLWFKTDDCRASIRGSAPSSAACSTGGWPSGWSRRTPPAFAGLARWARRGRRAGVPTPARHRRRRPVDRSWRRASSSSPPRAASAATHDRPRWGPRPWSGPNLAGVGEPDPPSPPAGCRTPTRTWPAGCRIPRR